MTALQKPHPELSRTHLILASIGGWGKFKDPEQVKHELGKFLAACPAPLDAGVLGMVSSSGSREQIAALAASVRSRPAENNKTEDLRWMEFVRNARQSAGDLSASERIADQILEQHPKSGAAKSILEERWNKQHPYPATRVRRSWKPGRGKPCRPIGRRQRWPDDSLILSAIFSSLATLPDTPTEEIAKKGDELMAAYRRNPNWYGMPPVEFRVAREFTKRKVNLDKTPGLVDEGYRTALKRAEQADDRNSDEIVAMFRESVLSLKLERAHTLLAWHEAMEQGDKAREIETELAGLRTEKPYLKSSLLQAQAHAAELLGRKLDA